MPRVGRGRGDFGDQDLIGGNSALRFRGPTPDLILQSEEVLDICAPAVHAQIFRLWLSWHRPEITPYNFCMCGSPTELGIAPSTYDGRHVIAHSEFILNKHDVFGHRALHSER